MEKKITCKDLNDLLVAQVKDGQQMVLTSERGDSIALVSMEDLEIVKEFESMEDQIDLEAISEGLSDDCIDWDEFIKE